MDEKSIIDGLKKICICNGIQKKTIEKAIRNGADTVAAVGALTGSGSGTCKGMHCRPKIEEILRHHKTDRE